MVCQPGLGEKVESMVGSFGHTGLQGLAQVAFWVLPCRDEWALGKSQ